MKRIYEAEAHIEHVEVVALEMSHEKKYGFLSWDDDCQMACLIEFDSVEAINEYYCTDLEFSDLDKMKVGESFKNCRGTIYTRIW